MTYKKWMDDTVNYYCPSWADTNDPDEYPSTYGEYLKWISEPPPRQCDNRLLLEVANAFGSELTQLMTDFRLENPSPDENQNRSDIGKRLSNYSNRGFSRRVIMELIGRSVNYLTTRKLLRVLGSASVNNGVLENIRKSQDNQYFRAFGVDATPPTLNDQEYSALASATLLSGMIQSKWFSALSYDVHLADSLDIIDRSPEKKQHLALAGTETMIYPLTEWLEFTASLIQVTRQSATNRLFCRLLYLAPTDLQILLYAAFLNRYKVLRPDRFRYYFTEYLTSARFPDFFHLSALVPLSQLTNENVRLYLRQANAFASDIFSIAKLEKRLFEKGTNANSRSLVNILNNPYQIKNGYASQVRLLIPRFFTSLTVSIEERDVIIGLGLADQDANGSLLYMKIDYSSH
jgi:hypothetical protein